MKKRMWKTAVKTLLMGVLAVSVPVLANQTGMGGMSGQKKKWWHFNK